MENIIISKDAHQTVTEELESLFIRLCNIKATAKCTSFAAYNTSAPPCGSTSCEPTVEDLRQAIDLLTEGIAAVRDDLRDILDGITTE